MRECLCIHTMYTFSGSLDNSYSTLSTVYITKCGGNSTLYYTQYTLYNIQCIVIASVFVLANDNT